MADESGARQYPCPSCGKTVSTNDLKCEFCGVDLKSGESFQTQVGRQKSKARHAEHFADTVLVGVIMLFALLLTGGYLYQRRASKMMTGDLGNGVPPGVRPMLLAMDLVDQLAAIADSDLSEEEKKKQAATRIMHPLYNPVFADDQFRPGRDTAVRRTGFDEVDRDPKEFARVVAKGILKELNDLDSFAAELDKGGYNSQSSAFGSSWGGTSRRGASFGPDFDFGAYRKLLGNLRARMEWRIEMLGETA